MWEAYFFGALLRMAQAALQAAPFIVTGLFVAGVFRYLLGTAYTRKLFAADTRRSLLQAWLIGMLLPVCSFGVLPVAREMRRAGLSGGTILAFALSAPLFNPLSVLYGLTLSEPWTILVFSLCTLVVVTIVGWAWDRIFPNCRTHDNDVPPLPPGAKRYLAAGLFAAREMAGPTLGYLALGLLGVGALSIALPPTGMQHSVQHDDPWAPCIMAAVALPAYASPMLAMNQLGSMFQHGNSVGAAFSLLVLGAGMNLGLLAWACRAFGVTKSAAWLGLLLSIVMALSYGIERPLYPADVDAADHTHAFDVYCRPFEVGTPNIGRLAWNELKQNCPPHELLSAGILAFLIVAGVVLRLADPQKRSEAWLAQAASDERPAPWYSRRVPSPVVGALIMSLIVVLSIVGCFAFYPRADQAFREIENAGAEALHAAMTGETAHAERWLPIYEDWIRKLQVGIYLRGGRLSEFHRIKAQLLLDRLELLEHELEHDDRQAVARLCTAIDRSRARLRGALETSFPDHF